jgi:hypothetical protein
MLLAGWKRLTERKAKLEQEKEQRYIERDGFRGGLVDVEWELRANAVNGGDERLVEGNCA